MTATPFKASTSHAALGPDFYDPVDAAAFPQHILRYRNHRWSDRVGLSHLSDEEWIAHFGQFEPLPGSFAQPLALRYHGHQFRVYNPDLGDGRGFLFAQLHDLEDGRLLDLGTKGSGQTPWSRTADGRLTLKGGLREILATEMLEALGVYTSKTFSLIETGEPLYRNDEPSPTRSSVLVRLSHSHIRIGSFQRLAYRKEEDNLQKLLDYTIRTYMPHVWRDELSARTAAFVGEVCRNVARTGAQWMMAGFVHGVLNTDNINVTGESFDYGPWRFLPTYDPGFTAAYFDETGLYAYGRQPETLAWNLVRLAGCLLPLASKEELEEALQVFWPALQRELSIAMLKRLGLTSRSDEEDADLIARFYGFLLESRAPFEQAIFDWRGGLLSEQRAAKSPSALLYATPQFEPVHLALQLYEPVPDVNLDHPYFQRGEPVTMLLPDVEAIWSLIDSTDDWSGLDRKLSDIAEMSDAYGTRIIPRVQAAPSV
ncbi:UPF0061 protein [Agaricicola taiwanensis]|uniref:Protein nucleotidyltransferase YdiU n=1 Tax=Agaricicola taiwanensis TaxID=591372 RepID=A0A8J2VXE4_9RHOB|nr:YdiU family protein [Agaricicola taiwanensis]GGE41626.1 UPF0061 protein [Agaricicola taiwanensis]